MHHALAVRPIERPNTTGSGVGKNMAFSLALNMAVSCGSVAVFMLTHFLDNWARLQGILQTPASRANYRNKACNLFACQLAMSHLIVWNLITWDVSAKAGSALPRHRNQLIRDFLPVWPSMQE